MSHPSTIRRLRKDDAAQRCWTACSAVASHSRHCSACASACWARRAAPAARAFAPRASNWAPRPPERGTPAPAELGPPRLGLGVRAPPLAVDGLADLLLDGAHPGLERADVVARDLAD